MPSSPFALLRFKGLIVTGLGVTISLIWKHKKCRSKKASLGQATTLEKLPNEVLSDIIIICSSKTTMDNLPDEVLSDIFTRLSAKQLTQMRCVSKSWKALLSDSSFIKSHLTRSLQNNDDKVLLFSRSFFSLAHGRPRPFTARRSHSPNVELTNFHGLPALPEGDCGCRYIVGSVDGLVCFNYTSYTDFDLYIWNPSIHAMLTLPRRPVRDLYRMELGFGYDPVSKDYKVLKLNMEAKSEVYSMRTGSWKLISHTFPSRVKIHKNFYNQVYVNGHLHWLCDSELEESARMIVGFDLHLETFNEIALPDVLYRCSNVLGVLGGKLCVMSKGRSGRKWEVWVMNEYGVAESWVKDDVLSRCTRDVSPYGFTSRGDFLFHDARCLYLDGLGLYDPIANKAKTFRIKGNVLGSKVVEYVDSLVWVVPPTRES